MEEREAVGGGSMEGVALIQSVNGKLTNHRGRVEGRVVDNVAWDTGCACTMA